MNPLLIDVPAELQSARLVLRPPRPGDGAMLYPAVSETLPALREFLATLPWVSGAPSLEVFEAFSRNAASNVLARKDLPFLMLDRASGVLHGVCGLQRPDWTVPSFEVGYWCRQNSQGQGYVTEAVEAVCAMALNTLGAARIAAVTDEANAASRRVAERCGFVLEGVLRAERRAPDGRLRNTCVYARHPEAAQTPPLAA